MNLLKHYIKEVYSVEDVSERFKNVWKSTNRPMVEIKMRVNCYGVEEDVKTVFFDDEWSEAYEKGFYMA